MIIDKERSMCIMGAPASVKGLIIRGVTGDVTWHWPKWDIARSAGIPECNTNAQKLWRHGAASESSDGNSSSCSISSSQDSFWIVWNEMPRILTISLLISLTCIEPEMLSRSLRISCKFFVPKMFRNVVCANSLVEWWAFSTLATDTVALDTR